ncbi:uncharacterized protein TNCT_637431 [Trichonephila clavata]|uniref:Uncharacterized protein n=1 Tax=Trichonephila clavata TaxID=2740835 RepID=A0A8X6HEA6_TRICU|nr:uncharacterized protein TNCT_637431 [Trichonephila clavata]
MTSSKSTEHRLLRSERLYQFRYTIVQGLKPDECQKRLASCEWLLQQQNTDNGFIAHILWTKEAFFPRNRVFNHHNSHIWSQVNPAEETSGTLGRHTRGSPAWTISVA